MLRLDYKISVNNLMGSLVFTMVNYFANNCLRVLNKELAESCRDRYLFIKALIFYLRKSKQIDLKINQDFNLEIRVNEWNKK